MSGTTEKDITITYPDGSVERERLWMVDDIDDTDLDPGWMDAWDDAEFQVFGLDAAFDGYVCVNLAQVRKITVRDVESQDAPPAPPVEQSSYDLRHF